jgi:hypothetical protein
MGHHQGCPVTMPAPWDPSFARESEAVVVVPKAGVRREGKGGGEASSDGVRKVTRCGEPPHLFFLFFERTTFT